MGTDNVIALLNTEKYRVVHKSEFWVYGSGTGQSCAFDTGEEPFHLLLEPGNNETHSCLDFLSCHVIILLVLRTWKWC